MINERKFASSYSSFWRLTLPLSESYVRSVNSRLTSFVPPYQLSIPPERKALVSELSFRYFSDLYAGRKERETQLIRPEDFEEIALGTWQYVRTLSGSLVDLAPPTMEDHKEALILAERIKLYFKQHEPWQPLRSRPKFAGCGIVESCEGDILAGSVLYEIKNVERDFRGVDLRQLLTYCALNYAAGSHSIDAVGLLNARSGMYFRISLSALCLGMAGAPAPEILSEIVRFMSDDQGYN